jgi:hypothetical protein
MDNFSAWWTCLHPSPSRAEWESDRFSTSFKILVTYLIESHQPLACTHTRSLPSFYQTNKWYSEGRTVSYSSPSDSLKAIPSQSHTFLTVFNIGAATFIPLLNIIKGSIIFNIVLLAFDFFVDSACDGGNLMLYALLVFVWINIHLSHQEPLNLLNHFHFHTEFIFIFVLSCFVVIVIAMR